MTTGWIKCTHSPRIKWYKNRYNDDKEQTSQPTDGELRFFFLIDLNTKMLLFGTTCGVRCFFSLSRFFAFFLWAREKTEQLFKPFKFVVMLIMECFVVRWVVGGGGIVTKDSFLIYPFHWDLFEIGQTFFFFFAFDAFVRNLLLQRMSLLFKSALKFFSYALVTLTLTLTQTTINIPQKFAASVIYQTQKEIDKKTSIYPLRMWMNVGSMSCDEKYECDIVLISCG